MCINQAVLAIASASLLTWSIATLAHSDELKRLKFELDSLSANVLFRATTAVCLLAIH